MRTFTSWARTGALPGSADDAPWQRSVVRQDLEIRGCLHRDLLFENTNVGGEGIGISLRRDLIGGGVVGVELGDDAFVPQLLPFVVRNFGQLRASFRERGLGTGLIKLMVKIRCVDLGQQLVLFDVCPDIHQPAL